MPLNYNQQKVTTAGNVNFPFLLLTLPHELPTAYAVIKTN